MLNIPTQTADTVVMTVDVAGPYAFVATVPAGGDCTFKLNGHEIPVVGWRPVNPGAAQLLFYPVYLIVGDQLSHVGNAAKLYGARLADELYSDDYL